MSERDIPLIEAVGSGDQAALGTLYDRYSAALFGVVLKIVGRQELAEEVLQDTFVKIWRSATSYDAAKSKPFTWMLNIARNTAIDLVRTKQHRMASKIQDVEAHVYHLGSDRTRNELEHLGMDKVLEGLKTENRELIQMAYYQGYTQQEIAERTGLPLGTVKSRMRSAMLQLKEALKDHR